MLSKQRSMSGKTQALIQRALDGLAGQGLQRAGRRAAARAAGQRMHFEALEPRLLMSADLLPLPVAALQAAGADTLLLSHPRDPATLGSLNPLSLQAASALSAGLQAGAQSTSAWVPGFDTGNFSSTLTPLAPLGSFVHAGGVSGSIDSAGSTDRLSLDVQGGQAVALRFAAPSTDLQARLEAWQNLSDGSWVQLGFAEAGQPGEALNLQVVMQATGTLYIDVVGLAGTGAYTVELFLGAVLETTDSTSSGDALDLGAAMSPLPGGAGARNAVIGRLSQGSSDATPILVERFNQGLDYARWSISTYDNAYWYQTYSDQEGSYALGSGAASGPETGNLTSAVLRVDLPSGDTEGLQLQFDQRGFDYTHEAFSGNAFSGDELADGVAISVDNTLWVPVSEAMSARDEGYEHHRLDLGAALARWGLQASGQVYIKFLHANVPEVIFQGEGPTIYNTGYREWDNIVVDRQGAARWRSPVSVQSGGPVFGDQSRLIDGVTPPNDADAYSSENGIYLLPSNGSVVDFDLGSVQRLTDLSLSLGAGSGYLIESSLDGLDWVDLLVIDSQLTAERNGLQRISTASDTPGHVAGLGFAPIQSRYLRLSQLPGSLNVGAVAELQARTGESAAMDSEDWYRLDLSAGQTASFAMALPQGGTAIGLSLELFDQSGNLLTFNAPATGASAAIPSFKAAADGVYSLRLAGNLDGDYQLAVTRDALLAGALVGGADITGQPLVATRVSEAQGSSSGRLRVAVQGDNGVVSGMLNDSTRFNFEAVAVDGSQIDTLAELSAFDVVLIGNHNVQHEYEGFASALRAWVEAGGGLVATGWTVFGGGLATGNVVSDLDAVVPVQLNGTYSSGYNGFMQMTGAAHPAVDGIGSFQLDGIYNEFPVAGIDADATLLATVNGQVGVAVAEQQSGRSAYLGPTYFYNYGGSVDTGLDKLLEQSVAWAAGRSAQQFVLRAAAGDNLVIDAVPAGVASAAPVNDLLAVLTLLDSQGQVLASSNDGSSLLYTPTQSGSYTLLLSSEAGVGDAVLRVTGSTADPDLAMRVLSTSLDGTSRASQYPSYIDLQFESPLLLTSIDAHDLTINGQAASGVSILGPDRLRFDLTQAAVVRQDGDYLLQISAGSFSDAAGRPVAGWAHGFTLDTTLPVVTGSTLAQGEVVDGNPMVLHFSFSEALATALLDSGDVQLVNLDADGTPTVTRFNLAASTNLSLASFTVDADSLGVSVGLPQLAEGRYRLTLVSGSNSFSDLLGLPLNGGPSNPLPSGQGDNSGDDFVLDFAVDQLPQALGELPALGVPGTLVYGKTVAGDLFNTTDQDEFTVQLDAGQVLSVALDPTHPGTALRMRLALLDESLAVVAQADGDAGAGLLLQTLGAGNGLPAGHYTLRLTALAGSGGYRLTAAVNARVEAESLAGGAANDALADAENLASSFISLGNGGSRAAVIGSRITPAGGEAGNDHYRFTLLQGQQATAALAWAASSSSGSLALDLLAADGTLLASSEAGSVTGRVQRIADFHADVAGDYLLRVRGNGNGLYSLAVTRSLSLDLSLAAVDGVVDISRTLQALGNLGNGAGNVTGGAVRVAVHGGTSSFLAALNNSVLGGISAVSVNGNQLDTLAELNAYDVVVIGSQYVQSEFALFDTALRTWVEAGGGIVATGWTVYGAGSASGPVRPNIDAIVPVNTSGSYNYNLGGSLVIVDGSHPITDGVSNFVMPGIYSEFPSGGVDAGAQVLALINGSPAVVVGNAGTGRGVYFGPTLTEWTGSPTGNLDRLIEQAVLWAGGDRADDYLISVNAGDVLTLATRTPGDGAAQPPNSLDPRLELIDPAGNTVASDSNSAADGRNALLVATATDTGTYKLRVRIDNGSGAYVVTVAGATGAALANGPVVTAVTPANGVVLNSSPTTITFQLSEGVRADSVSTSDLVLDSGGSVTGVQLLAGNQVAFSVDIALVEGAFAYHLAAGAFTDLQGEPSGAFAAGFIIDVGGAFVTASTPGAEAGAPLNSWTFSFNEAINPGSASIADVAVFTGPSGQDLRNQIGSVTVSGNTLLVNFNNQFAPGDYHIEIGPDLRDLAGNPMDQDRDGSTGEEVQDRFGATTTLRSPDLLPLTLTSAASANFGTPLSVTWSVRNAGNEPARSSWYDRLYLSGDSTLSGNDVYLGEFFVSPNPLAADASYTLTRQVTLPLDAAYAPGTYHLLLVSDIYGQQGEADESNNLLAGADLVLGVPPLPDLAVANVAAPATIEAGKPVTIQWTARNLGDAATNNAWYDSIYLSSDNLLGADILLADIYYNNAVPIAAGGELARSAQVTIPTDRTGNWYILVRGDNYGYINEYLNEGNNFGFSPATVNVVVPTEDLVVSALTTAASGTFGQTLNVVWTVNNQGTGPSIANWTDQVWLSRDGVLSNDDVSLGSFSSAGDTPLAAGASYERSRDIMLPLISSLGAGSYQVLVQTDYHNNEPETNEANNLRASGTVTLALPALADLTVANVIVPAGLRSGDAADIRFTLTNQGSAAASDFYYRLGLSDSADTNSIDVFLGDFRFNDTLSAGESVQLTQRVTLPIDRPGNWYVGVIADIYNSVYEHVNEVNNSALSSLVGLPLPPLVDLRVRNIVAPLDAIAGQQVPITWTVVNEGTAPIIGGVFTDYLYLSTDGGVSLNVFLGSYTFEGDLAAGASVTRSQSVGLPAEQAANYTVVVVTDAAGNHYEAGGELNNRTVDNTRIATVLPPLPNLVVTSITPPSEAFSSTQTEVSWVVRNNGNGATSAPNWLDEVHLSLNAVFGDGDDIALGTAYNVSYLDVGDSYVGHLTFTVPRGLSGDYHLLVRTDVYNQVFENNLEADNTAASSLLHISLTPPPDLKVQAVQAPSQAFSGQPMALNWTITNAGDGRTLESAWYDRVYVSTDNVFDAGDLSLGLFYHAGALNPDASYNQNQQVTLPVGQSGERWFFVVTDALNHVYEHVYESNNSGLDATATQVLLTPPPDLEVESITLPASVRAGNVLNLQFTVRNFGATPTAESYWTDVVYLSSDAMLDAGDLALGQVGHYGVLNQDSAYTSGLSVTMPNTLNGPYFVLVRTDAFSQVFEGYSANGIDPEGNNLLASDSTLDVQLRPADLVVDTVAAPATGEAGRQISVSWSDRNAGIGSVQAGNWTDQILVSSDAIFGDDDDVLLGSVTVDNFLTQTAQVTLPFSLASGNYTLYVRTDAGNRVFEGSSGEANNNSAGSALAVTRRTPDLVASHLSVALPDTAAGRIAVGWRVDNLGENRSDSTYWTDSVYLSRDAALGSGDLLVGNVFRGNPLEVGEGYEVNTSFALPAGLGSGDYYLIVRTDVYGQVTEGSIGEANNTTVLGSSPTVPVPITVPPVIVPAAPRPDLQITAVDAPATGISGQAIEVSWTVSNAGDDPTGSRDWYDAIFLSRDLVFDRNTDLYLGFRYQSGGLGAHESYNASASVTVPLGQSGPFYVFVVADRGGAIAETVETNNAGFDGAFTQVNLAPPADLVVGEITIPATGIPGSLASISYSVSNQGSNAALGSWRDTLYLSADSSWDIGDLVFGSAQVYGPLNGGASYSQTVTAALPGLTPGTYHVIVRSDILNNIVESNNANNLSASLDAVQIDVQALTLGTVVQGTLGAGQSLFYKLVVEAGETVRLTLDGAGQDNGNELYLRYGSMPTRGQFDAAGKDPFVPDQAAVIPTTQAGTYYVMLYGASGGTQAFSLVAESLPFSLQQADFTEIGDAGPATLRIDGARFAAGAKFYLINAAGVRIDASQVHIASGSEAYITFDARGAARGAYTLGADDGNGNGATLAQAITVGEGHGARVEVRFDGPAQVRPGRVVLANVVYANLGDADTLAPLLIISSPTGTEFGSTAESMGLSSAVQLLGVGPRGQPGVLRPGDENTLPLLFKSVNAPMRFTAKSYEASSTVAIDFDLVKRSLRMPGLTDTEWEIRWATRLQPRIGGTWGDYVRLVNQLSQRFSTPDHTITDVRELFDLAFRSNASFLASMQYSGRLLHADSGAPMADVEMAVYRTEGEDSVLAGHGRTDATGAFRVLGLQPGHYILALARSVVDADGNSALEYPYAFDLNRNGIADVVSPAFDISGNADVAGGNLHARLRPVEVTPEHVDAQPALATDAAGQVHMMWMRDGALWHAVNDGAGWRDGQPLPGNVSGDSLQLVADPRLINGNREGLLATWRQGEGNAAEVYYSVGGLQPDGSWQWTAAAKLTDNTQFDGAYAVGVDAAGKPVLLVQRKDASNPSDDLDLYGSEFTIQDPQFVSALAERTRDLVAWLETKTDDELVALGIHRVRFSKSIGNVNIPLIGSVKSEIRVDFQAQIDCTLVFRGNGAFKFDLNVKGVKVEIEGRAGGDVRFTVDKDTCAYVFKSARISAQVAGAVNFPLTWIPFVGPALTAIGVQGRFELAAAGNLIWDAGADFPGWWSRGQGSFRGSLGFNWEGSIPWTGMEAVVRGLVNVNGKWDDQGLGLRDPAISGSVLVRVKHGWFFGGTGWTEYTYSFPGSDLGSTGIDGELLSLDDAVYSGSLYNTAVSFGFDPMVSGTLNDYAGSGEATLTHNLGTESDPVMAESPTGELWAAWSDTSGVQVSQRVGGQWQAPALLPGSGGHAVRGLALAFDGSGHALALWNRLDMSSLNSASTSQQIQAVMEGGGDLVSARMAPDGSWSALQTVAAGAGEEQQAVLVRLSDGNLLAAWALRTGALDDYRPALTVQSALWDATADTWGATTDIAQGLVQGSLRLARQADGRALLVWSEAVNSSNATVLRTANRAADGSWSSAGTAVISISQSLLDVAQAISAGSTAAAAPIQTSGWGLPSPPDNCCDDDPDPPPYDPEPVVPRDPNDILGPDGFGDEHWIAASTTLAYTIRFENAADAAAPAQEVVVTQQLDADIDWRSFRVDDFGFGDQRIQLDGKSAFYSKRLDYSATRGYLLDVSAVIDVSTGIVTWKLSTIDATTGEVPTDAQLGFLPPNKDADGNKDGRGEGFLSYTVKARRNVPTGTVIDASARIIFDTEEPIDTPAIFHTLDAGKPASAVTALAALSDEPEFTVSWTGADAEGGSAIASYTVYVSTDGSDFQTWLVDTTLTEAIFIGERGSRYAFYSVASDNAGNVEAAPAEADAQTTVAAGFGAIAGLVFDDSDADGTHDIGEPGVAGWTIFLDTDDDGVLDAGETSTLTDTAGAYRFEHVLAGQVVVGQVISSGWIGTYPSTGRQPVTVRADSSTESVDFGAFQHGSASGVAFDDNNANGQRDAGEALLSGISVQLDRDGDGSVEASVLTLDDGSWRFDGLLAGNYRLRSVVAADRLLTLPGAGHYSVTVTSGSQHNMLDFGSVAAAHLTGSAYEDVDGNGQRGAAEAGLAGWTVFLDTNDNSLRDADERFTVSGSDGAWRFDALLPGSYRVAQLQQGGWLQTAPGAGGVAGRPLGSTDTLLTGSAQLLELPDAALTVQASTASVAAGNRAAQRLIGLDALRGDARFSGIDGSGVSVVVIDTGIDVDNAFFGPDANHDGIADRILYQYDFANGDADASDRNGHGSNIGSLIGAADGAYGGLAPGADLIALKVFEDNGKGYFSYLENALRWVVAHADEYRVGVVNLSLGDGGNWSSAIARFGLGDELAALAARNIIVTAAAGNSFARFGGAWGVAYPAADPAVLAVGATWSADVGGPWAFSGGSTDYNTGADRITSFSQRDPRLVDGFAPGTGLVGANANGGLSAMQGTSQASAMMAGVATLAQDLALQTLGRRLSLTEFHALLASTSVRIVDGDDENDNVRNSGQTFGRVNLHALAEAILALPGQVGGGGGGGGGGSGSGGGGGGGTQPGSVGAAAHQVTVSAGQTVGGLDFGNFALGRVDGVVFEDANSNGSQDGGEGGLAGYTVFLDANNNALQDTDEASTVTDGAGAWYFADLGPGLRTAHLAPRLGYVPTAEKAPVDITSGAHLTVALAANGGPTLEPVTDIDTPEGQTVTVALGGHDHPGDTLRYSLVGDLPAGVSLNTDTGEFRWQAADGELTQAFTVRVSDSAGSIADRSFAVRVHNVAPTLVASGAATVEEGQDYSLALSAADPGQDSISQWVIDWGDGIVQTLTGNPGQAVHRYAQPGSYVVLASATDEDGSYSVAGPVVQVSAAVLQVARFDANATGFVVRFNRAIDAARLNLYSAADNPLGSSDIVFTDAAGQAVAGSVVVDADLRGLRFVRTGGALAAGSYSVRLASGAQAFVDSSGGQLDGNRDGTRGDAYTNRFDVAGGGAVLSVADVARGPGQPVNIPATGGGLPIMLANAAGATRIAFTLRHDAALIGFVGASNGAGLPAGSTLSVDLSIAGEVRVLITTGAPLGAAAVELVRLQAGVPSAAAYGARQVLDLGDIVINEGAIAARDDDGLQVVAYLGDGSGDRAYSLLDVTRLQRVITRADSGFAAFPLVDPTLLGDINASGNLTSLDAARLQQQVGGLTRPEIPPIPSAGAGFLDQFFAPQSLAGLARIDLGASLQSSSSAGTAGSSAWVSQWLSQAQGGHVAVKVKAGSHLIKLAPKL